MEAKILYQKCNACNETLYMYELNSDKYEGPINIKPINMEFLGLNLSHDVCCEGSDVDIEVKCKNCDSLGTINLSSGYQTYLSVEYEEK